MRQSVISNVIAIIILFFSLILLPSYFIGVIQWRTDMNTCQTAARNFIDVVIDEGMITEKALTDLNLSIASCIGDFEYEYYREEKVVNPGDDGTYVTSWVHVEVDEDTEWHTGDICTIVIEQTSANLFQRIAASFMSYSYSNMEVRLSGMVR